VHGSISFIAICSCYSFPGDTRLIADLIFRHATGSRPAHRVPCARALLKITMHTLRLVTKPRDGYRAAAAFVGPPELKRSRSFGPTRRLVRERPASPRTGELVARPCATEGRKGGSPGGSRWAVLGGITVPLAGSACSRSRSETLRSERFTILPQKQFGAVAAPAETALPMPRKIRFDRRNGAVQSVNSAASTEPCCRRAPYTSVYRIVAYRARIPYTVRTPTT